MIKNGTFDQIFYSSLGIEHFTISLRKTDNLKVLDLSENDIGVVNFKLLLPIFKINNKL